MDSLVVEGGNPLRGTVPIGGAKNAALPILAACILAEGPVTLHNVPRLSDVDFMTLILAELGVVSRWVGEHSLQLEAVDESAVTAHYDLVRKMRGSFCVLGPLLGKRGRAVVSLPGGCVIGTRPIDLHLKGLRALGAKLHLERGYVVGDGTELLGGEIYLGGPNGSTCTGTANVLMAAVLATGRTTIVSVPPATRRSSTSATSSPPWEPTSKASAHPTWSSMASVDCRGPVTPSSPTASRLAPSSWPGPSPAGK